MNRRGKDKSNIEAARGWLESYKDAIHALVGIGTLISIPVGAYFFLLTSINGVRRNVDGVESSLGVKMDAGFAELRADMRVLIERQYNTEKNTENLRQEIRDTRSQEVSRDKSAR